ncbi:MAG: dephospho-CoA kinase [Gemmatimonadaceae bacterium]
MRVIGLTGNIAAGKSTVAAGLAAAGLPVIDADSLAREVVAPGTPALAAIVARWGPTILAADGTLDRAALRRRILADPADRTALEAITHPAIAARRAARTAELAATGAPVIICDIPLLFEAQLEDTVDEIVLVDAPVAVRRARLIQDRGIAPAEADALIAAQMPADQKREHADVVIDNAGSRADLDAAIAMLVRRLLDPSATRP